MLEKARRCKQHEVAKALVSRMEPKVPQLTKQLAFSTYKLMLHGLKVSLSRLIRKNQSSPLAERIDEHRERNCRRFP